MAIDKADGKSRERAYHEDFAEKMIQAVKKGTAPWMKPWKPGEKFLPHNFKSDRGYSGGNAIRLALEGAERGYSDPRWGGYRQIQAAGGQVKAGEKGTPVLYVDRYRQRVDRDEGGKPRLDAEGHSQYKNELRDRPLVKVQYVFNVEQTEGLKLPPVAREQEHWRKTYKRAEDVMRKSGVPIEHKAGDRAYYDKDADKVTLPERKQFTSAREYYQTTLHELVHATGHKDRLNRPTLNLHEGFGTETYAREELRAEIGALMTGDRLGTGHQPRHGAAYVKSWVKALEEDAREIRSASVDAQKASDWLVSRERVREVDAERPKPAAEKDAAPAKEAAKTVERPETRSQPAPAVEMGR